VRETLSRAYSGLASSCARRPRRALGRDEKEAVVGADEQPPVAGRDGERAPVAADTGVDHREVHPLGHVRQRVGQDERALEDCCGGMPCVMSMICASGAMPLHHAVARPDEGVLQPEVGEKRDDHGRSLKGHTRESRHEALEVVRIASAATRIPAASAARVVSGPIETAKRSSPSAPKARAADADASTTRSPSGGGSGRSSRVR
jgi:hypothetical protein